jgi:lysozyme family protein
MADIKLYFPKVLKHEGGFVNDPTDKGGATNMGVTLGTWRNVGYDKDGDGDIDATDIRLLSPDDAMMVCKVGYWDRWRADSIKNQSIAETLVEWVWGSGKWGIILPQRILRVKDDGRVGMQTINAVNSIEPKEFHEKIRIAKIDFINDLVKRSVTEYKLKYPAATETDLLKHTQMRFLKGWTNRINEYKFQEQVIV